MVAAEAPPAVDLATDAVDSPIADEDSGQSDQPGTGQRDGSADAGCRSSIDSDFAWAYACDASVGRFADGGINGESEAFGQVFLSYQGMLGCPFDNRGGKYVHEYYGVDVQDFKTDSGTFALAFNPDLGCAFVLNSRS